MRHQRFSGALAIASGIDRCSLPKTTRRELSADLVRHSVNHTVVTAHLLTPLRAAASHAAGRRRANFLTLIMKT